MDLRCILWTPMGQLNVSLLVVLIYDEGEVYSFL